MGKEVDKRLLKRAADLWTRAILFEGWNNGDTGLASGLGSLVMNTVRSKPDFVEKVRAFHVVFLRNLESSFELAGTTMTRQEAVKVYGDRWSDPKACPDDQLPRWFLNTEFSVDYHPNLFLRECLNEVSLSESCLPVKSQVILGWDYTSLSSRFGYDAPLLYHVPLDFNDGSWCWLVTDFLIPATPDGLAVRNAARRESIILPSERDIDLDVLVNRFNTEQEKRRKATESAKTFDPTKGSRIEQMAKEFDSE